VKGSGNQQDYGNRIYDTRLGRWFSLDPLMKKYPNESNYSFVGNSPLLYKDIDGRDKVVTITIINKDGKTTQIRMTDKNYFEYEFRVTTTNPWDQTFERYKKDKHVDMIIDLANPSKNPIVVTVSFGTAYKTDILDGTMVGNSMDLVSGLFKAGDESGNIKYGYRLIGTSGKPNDYTDGLPKPSEDSEFLDLGLLLSVVGNFREEETFIKLGERVAQLKGINIDNNLKLANFLENVGTSIETTMDALGEREKLTPNEGNQNVLNTKPKPVVRTTYISEGTFSQGWKSSRDESKPDTMEKRVPLNKKQ